MTTHDLFPPLDDEEEGTEEPEIQWVQVARLERGKLVFAPRMYRAEELKSLEDIHNQYGGGDYEIIGRDSRRITARRRYNLPGPAAPLEGDTHQSPTLQSPAPAAAPAAPAPSGGGFDPAFMLGLMQLQNQQTQSFMGMITALLQSQKSDSNAFVQAMAQQNQANLANMSTFFTKTMELRSPQAAQDPSKAIDQALALVKKVGLVTEEEDTPQESTALEDLTQMIGAATQFAQATRPADPAPALAPEVPHAPRA